MAPEGTGRADAKAAAMLHETMASTPTARAASATGAQRPIAGGEAWIMPREPAVHPWLTVSAPQIRVVDRRAARAAAIPTT